MSSLIVYLAGPYSNCNEKQKTRWRQDIKAELKRLGHVAIDPVDHRDAWTPMMEVLDIEKSDVVIANLWKESIGTVVGIFEARRAGKPVILIDQNFIESRILKELVGEHNVVHSIEAAINKLDRDVSHALGQEQSVLKKDGTFQKFDINKLQRALKSACNSANLDDTILPVLISHKVLNRIRRSQDQETKSSLIKSMVFEELDRLATGLDQTYTEAIEKQARLLRDAWQKRQEGKDDLRVLEELGRQTDAQQREVQRLVQENRSLRRRLAAPSTEVVQSIEETFKNVADAVTSARFRFPQLLAFDDGGKAFQSSVDCPFHRPSEVYEALDLLAQYAEMRQGLHQHPDEDVREPGLKEWLLDQGSAIEYAPHESKTTKRNAVDRRERTVLYKGKEYNIFKHFKIGQWNANEAVRIHFECLGKDDNYMVLIGHVGRHLSLGSGQ